MLRVMRNPNVFAVVVVGLLGACYQDYQPATTPAPQFQPQPVYVQGPPGGQMDEQTAYAGPAGEFSGGGEATDGEPAIDAGPAPSANPEDPGYVMGTVTDAEIDTTLNGYGYWVEDAEYGRIWRPDATVVGVDFTPYETCGTWMWTDYGWTFACDWSWGWLPFHYGYWGWFDDYWAWVPDYTWSPAWVEWRTGGGYTGWRPVGPHVRDHRNGRGSSAGAVAGSRGPVVRDHRGRRNGAADWRFVTDRDLAAGRRIRPSLMHNNAEGLRVTAVVAKPSIRATSTATTRVTDVMKNRITARNAITSGRMRGTNTRDMRGGNYRPSSPSYGSGSTSSQPGSTVWTPPSRGWQQNRQQPSRTYTPYTPYTPPARSTQQPAQTFTPSRPSEPSRSYSPPRQTFTPSAPSAPSRSYAPPRQTFTPSTPSAPSRSYSPSRQNFTPSTPSAPSRSYAPSRQTFTPSAPSAPSRSYAPSSSSSSRSYSPSSSSSSSSRSSGSSSHSSGGGRRR